MAATDPALSFYSDNTAGVCPELLAAIAAANIRHKSYGEDPWTRRLDELFGAFFGAPVRSFVVTTGTAANALALATLTPPYGAVYAHEQAHVVQDECGAPAFFSGGARLALLPGEHGKLTAAALAAALEAATPSVHSVQPVAVTLTQCTELGTCYRPAEVAAIAAVARAHGLRLHVDGARLANALAFLGCHPGDVTWRAGVDVLSFGATKNGALAAEAVVFFDQALVEDFELRRKRAGHLLSKSRYASAQLAAYLESGLWRANAGRANHLAARIATAAGARLLHPVEANELFLRLGAAGRQHLRAAGFGFYDWGAPTLGHARFVVSWDQDEGGVAALCEALRELDAG